MKPTLYLLFSLFGCGAASAQTISADSSARRSFPGVLHTGTYFYRQPGDPKNVMRAGMDNMPIKRPDSLGMTVMPNAHIPPGPSLLPKGFEQMVPAPAPRRKAP